VGEGEGWCQPLRGGEGKDGLVLDSGILGGHPRVAGCGCTGSCVKERFAMSDSKRIVRAGGGDKESSTSSGDKTPADHFQQVGRNRKCKKNVVLG